MTMNRKSAKKNLIFHFYPFSQLSLQFYLITFEPFYKQKIFSTDQSTKTNYTAYKRIQIFFLAYKFCEGAGEMYMKRST